MEFDLRYQNCYQLVRRFAAEELGRDYPYYPTPDDPRENWAAFLQNMRDWTKVENPEPGDVVVLRIAGLIQHCGIVIGSNQMLHVLQGRNSTIERFDMHPWKTKIKGFYRW